MSWSQIRDSDACRVSTDALLSPVARRFHSCRALHSLLHGVRGKTSLVRIQGEARCKENGDSGMVG